MTEKISRSLFENILEHSPVAVLVTDKNGKMIFFNKEVIELFGYSKEEMINQEVEMLLPKNIRTQHRKQRSDYITSHSPPRLMGVGRDLFGVHKEGHFIPVEIGLNPIKVDGNQLVIATVINITERRKKEDQQIGQLIRNLERSNKELEEYAHLISHDLQNPLSVAYSTVEIIESEMKSETVLPFVDKLKSSISEMSELTNSLLALSHIVEERVEKVPLDLNELIKEVVADYKAKDFVHVGELQTIEGDPIFLRDLFKNLIGNAIKYCKPNHPPQIEIYGKSEEHFYALKICDNGMGLSDTSDIFKIFKRLPEGKDQKKGFGIGLAVCKKVVDLHQGEISVESKPGEGTTFTIKFPLSQK
ncbi:MAG: Adaptive-response sensory-kinase SasA [Chlamydiales bacterium]|nr:Adaptive-response sensory-kinase SasA [Chlamydiales bacterium]MCH9619797.1 Adaptive-response sensory-kinase SasA [Chlamydiales bacterium]MCH9623403.1 Adaptive-response sensory-kinase SasA [Chlamydiales bacterium]